MAGELNADELSADWCKGLETEVFIPVNDTIIARLADRFTEDCFDVMKNMKYFTSGELTNSKDISAGDICSLCKHYGLNETVIAGELNAFRQVYVRVKEDVLIDDLFAHSSKANKEPDSDRFGEPMDE